MTSYLSLRLKSEVTMNIHEKNLLEMFQSIAIVLNMTFRDYFISVSPPEMKQNDHNSTWAVSMKFESSHDVIMLSPKPFKWWVVMYFPDEINKSNYSKRKKAQLTLEWKKIIFEKLKTQTCT